MKRTQLKRDPEKVAEWQQASRKPLAPGVRRTRRSVPAGTKTKVRARSGGWCVVCLARNGVFCPDGLSRRQRHVCRVLSVQGRIRPIAHLHHVLPVQFFPEYELERDNLVGVCPGCHDEHERAHRRIPYEALPIAVQQFGASAGSTAVIFLENTYPKGA